MEGISDDALVIYGPGMRPAWDDERPDSDLDSEVGFAVSFIFLFITVIILSIITYAMAEETNGKVYVNTVDFTPMGTAATKVPIRTFINIILTMFMLVSGAIGIAGYHLFKNGQHFQFDFRLAHLFLAGGCFVALLVANCLYWAEARVYRCCRMYKHSEYEEI